MDQDDREILRALFLQTSGQEGFAKKKGWDTAAELRERYGVEVNAEGRVVALHIGNSNIQQGEVLITTSQGRVEHALLPLVFPQ